MSLNKSFQSWWNSLQYWYFQWELTTSLYVLEPGEKVIIHTIFLAILIVIIYAAVTYLSGHMIMFVHFMNGSLTEEQETET